MSEKINKFRRGKKRLLHVLAAIRSFPLIAVFLFLTMTGCGNTARQENSNEPGSAANAESRSDSVKEDIAEDRSDSVKESIATAEDIERVYRGIYEETVDKSASDTLDVIRHLVDRLGENGYAAVDSENQINMVCPEQIRRFCESVEAQEESEATLIVVVSAVNCFQYEFTTKDGNVEVQSSYYQYRSDCLETISTQKYRAYSWVYSEEGYLFWEEYRMPGFDGPSGHTAVRVEPLDEVCRELNRKYLRPIGYELNNLFTSDWNEDDWNELNFYDLYDALYRMKGGQYALAGTFEEGVSYEIPASEFESLFQDFLRIDGQMLRQYTIYHEDTETYRYRTRGMFDFAPTPYVPYPEVISCESKEDGTIELTVNAVWPEKNLGKAFCHEVVIRPLEDGVFQYVSNQVIPSEDNVDITWYTERLSDELWQEYYEKGYDLPVSDEEREEVEADCMEMMELISDLYKKADKGEALNAILSDETLYEMAGRIKEKDASVIINTIYSNMENYEKFEHFLNSCVSGERGSAVLYEILKSGCITRKKYLYDGDAMYVMAANCIWSSHGEPIVSYISYTRLKEWDYTKKGWFRYRLCVPEYPEVTEIVDGSRLIRVRPLSEENREMSEKCVLGLGYQGNNLLCSDWDIDHMEDLDYNGLYESFYLMNDQKRFEPEEYPNGIPKAEFENLMMEYLPVTQDEIRKYAVFDEKHQTYKWAALGCFNYAPAYFGTSVPEVTDIRENEDGTVTLTVDAVCELMLCDDAVITHELTVRFSENGSFQYLGNKILDNGIEKIPAYQYRIDSDERIPRSDKMDIVISVA